MSEFATLPRSTVPISQTLLLSFVGRLRFLSVACRPGSTQVRQTYQVNTYHFNQAVWTLEEIDNAFQMDLNEKGDQNV
jgi:hypothetical protein